MGLANIKISTQELEELKKYTQEQTGQKAVEKALIYFLKEARQRQIIDVLKDVAFQKGFNPLKLRRNER